MYKNAEAADRRNPNRHGIHARSKKAANREHRLFAKMTSTAAKDFDFVFPEDIARQIAIRIRAEQEAEEKSKQ
jgi:hypothetical protein